jgi:magnesium transporter
MKPIPLTRIAVPSSSVLSFLRTQVNNAFESPTVERAGVNRSRCAYTTSSRTLWSTTSGPRGGISNKTTRPSSTTPNLQPTSQSSPRLPEFSPTNRRCLSTSSSSHAWNTMFKSKKGMRGLLQSPAPPSNPSDDGSPNGSGFSSSLGRMMRTANELKMRCTELDEHGNVTLVSGEFKKSELIAKVWQGTSTLRNGKS